MLKTIAPWLVALMLGAPAVAQTYPDRPVHLVIPFAAGSSTDAIGCEVAQMLSRGFDRPFVADNRPGGLSIIGAAEVAKARPDGYTLLIGTSTSQAAAASLFKALPYDPEKSFVPIGRVAAVAFALVVRADLPVHSVQKLIDYGSGKNAKRLSWGYANSANQVAGAALVRFGKLDATDVSYKAVPQIVMDLPGGRLDFTVVDLTNLLPQIQAGKLRALAVTSSKAPPELPKVPPLGDTVPGFELLGWYGLFAPANTPEEIVASLSRKLQQGLADPAVQQRIVSAGMMPYPASGAETRAFVSSEIGKWRTLVRDAGVFAGVIGAAGVTRARRLARTSGAPKSRRAGS